MNYLLIGKPNVGKTSIYNILTGFDSNITHAKVGTTRDWHFEKIKDSSINIYDTPGILINDTHKKNILTSSFTKIIEKKINHFLYVIDYSDSFNEIDNFAITKLRKYNKNIILIVNKFDNFNQSPSPEITQYNIKDVIFLSCVHRYGFDELKTKIGVSKYNNNINKEQKIDFSLAILGKPNVGKSTLLNTILGYERASTSPIAGTTSDYVSDQFYYRKKLFKIFDTAGIGRKANVEKKSINFYSIKKSFVKIAKVDVAIILIDSKEGLDKQDKRIINMVTDKAKSILLLFNKIDLIKNKKIFQLEIIKQIEHTLGQIKNIKFFFIIKVILIYLFVCSKSYSGSIATNISSVVLGQDEAPVKIKIFSSLTCPHCANFHINVVPEIKKEYIKTGKVQLIFIDFPLDQGAFNASKLLHCLDKKKQILFLDTIYETQNEWTSGSNVNDININLKKIVMNFGINSAQFDKCLIDETISDKILNGRIDANHKYSIDSTPTIIINEKKLQGSASFKNIKKKIEKLI